MKTIGIIPARFASTRFPGKPLADIRGMSMIARVIAQARKVESLHELIVATDDQRIFDHVISLGEKVVMTSIHHQSGTDRCLEAFTVSKSDADLVVNIQGDEPLVDPSQIATLIELLQQPETDIATLAMRISKQETLEDPNKVKVVFSASGRAIYFSRHAIPYRKGLNQKDWLLHGAYFKHIGLYGYKIRALREICAMPPSPLELAESLEQLRWLENGKHIHVGLTEVETPAIDTPADLEDLLRKWVG